jgi:transcriptional regulator with XRE-family HTH domain
VGYRGGWKIGDILSPVTVFSIDLSITLWNNAAMIIGIRLRKLREERKLSQGDIEKRTGLLRCYISRVENGHTVPSLETLERLAAAMEIPLYQLFYEGERPPDLPNLTQRKSTDELAVEIPADRDSRFFQKVKRLLGNINDRDRRLLLYMAQKLANR